MTPAAAVLALWLLLQSQRLVRLYRRRLVSLSLNTTLTLRADGSATATCAVAEEQPRGDPDVLHVDAAFRLYYGDGGDTEERELVAAYYGSATADDGAAESDVWPIDGGD